MNTGIYGLQEASGSTASQQTTCETIPLSATASTAQQTWSVSPRPGVSRHFLLIQSPPAAAQSGYAKITLDGTFPEGYSVVLVCDCTGFAPPYVEVFAGGSLIYSAPRQPNRPAGEMAELVWVGGAWRRLSFQQESRYGNSCVSVAASATNARTFGFTGSSSTNSGSLPGNGVTANGTVANSTAVRYAQITNTSSVSRTVFRSIFQSPFTLTSIWEPNLSPSGLAAPATTALRVGVIAAFQSIASDGTPSALAIGFQIDNVGNVSGFVHNGSSLTTTPLGYTLPDIGGGQGGQNIWSALYWNPAGIAEWYIFGRRYLRQEGLSYSLPGTQYPSYYISAATGATTGTGNVSLFFLDGRYFAV